MFPGLGRQGAFTEPFAPGSLRRPLTASSREGLLPARAAHFPARTLGSGDRPQVPRGAASPEPATRPWLAMVQGQPPLGTRAVIRMCHTGAETPTDASSGPRALSSPPRAKAPEGTETPGWSCSELRLGPPQTRGQAPTCSIPPPPSRNERAEPQTD